MAENLLKAVLSEVERQEGGRIEVIRLNLDDHDFAEADSLRFCFAAMAVGTIAEGARLEINEANLVSGENTPGVEIYISQV